MISNYAFNVLYLFYRRHEHLRRQSMVSGDRIDVHDTRSTKETRCGLWIVSSSFFHCLVSATFFGTVHRDCEISARFIAPSKILFLITKALHFHTCRSSSLYANVFVFFTRSTLIAVWQTQFTLINWRFERCNQALVVPHMLLFFHAWDPKTGNLHTIKSTVIRHNWDLKRLRRANMTTACREISTDCFILNILSFSAWKFFFFRLSSSAVCFRRELLSPTNFTCCRYGTVT